MNINDLPACILLCRDAGISSFVWGHRGLGKSESHKDISSANGWGFIDLRGSQMEASDLKGLPKAVGNLTMYLPPADLPQSHSSDDECPACSNMTREEAKSKDIKDRSYCKGVLFLDEINRSEDDVLQAVFQLVLDKKIGEYEVPKGWSVHCAGNFAKGYNTNNFKDPAFLDRFCHLTVSANAKYCESWIDWMYKSYPESTRIIQFVSINNENLIGKVSGDLGFTIQPSPRSWAMIAEIERACERNAYPESAINAVISGIIGSTMAIEYQRFSCEVTPNDIINNGVDHYRNKLSSLSRNIIVGLTHGIASKCCSQEKEDRVKKEMENVCDFLIYLCKERDRDLAVALARKLAGQETSLDGAMLTNPKLAALTRKFIGKNKKKQDHESWIVAITAHPELSDLMHNVSWGKSTKRK